MSNLRQLKKKLSQANPEGERKMKELILYISHRSMGDEEFGSIKLNKLLFYSDFTAYLKLGKAITEMEYMRLDHGPAPKRFKPISLEMAKEKSLEIVESQFHQHTQRRPIPLRKADLNMFSAAEISLVDNIIYKLRGMNAHDVSELSHKFIGWQIAEEGEVIPYSVAKIEVREPSAKESAIAKKLLKRIKTRVF